MEILFRGKRADNGGWVFGYIIKNKNGDCFIKDTDYNVNNGKFNLIPYKVHPETVSQYTGLKDKNGVKIFLGDIVDTSSDFLFYKPENKNQEVVFRDGCFEAFESHFGWEGEGLINLAECEVIGNKWGNPELLKN